MRTASDINTSTADASRIKSASARSTRALVADLFSPKPVIYWIDFFLSITIGYAAAGVVFSAPNLSFLQIAAVPVAGLAIFRAVTYLHELAHQKTEDLPGFKIVWNLACGIPTLMPSTFYETHLDHHRSHDYGTDHDGEYLPLATGSPWRIVWFVLQGFLLPPYVFLRFLLTPISFLHPRLRTWTLERASALVINFSHRRRFHRKTDWKLWLALEWACFARAAILMAMIATCVIPWERLLQLYVIALFAIGLNHARSLVAHHYRSRGNEMTYEEQLGDSVTITGHPLLTELCFPLGLRYHTLHHMYPAIPYHNLGIAHRRLMAELPEDSPYRATVYPNVRSVLRELWNDSRHSAELSETGEWHRASRATQTDK
jgi:fatty acid desaturase